MILSAALALLMLGAPPPETKDAQRLARRSTLEYDVGHFEEALRDITQAYYLDPRPAMLFNLGQCHRALEHWKEAEYDFRNYLHKLPNAPNRDTVLKLIEEMHQHQSQSPPRPRPAAAQVIVQPPVQPPPLVEAARPQVVMEAPPPRKTTAAPAAAVNAVPANAVVKVSHPRPLAWVLGIAALACAGVAIYGTVYVNNFESVNNRIEHPTSAKQLQQDLATATAESPAAGTWQITAFATGIAAVAGATGTVFAW
jgi:tetratricopeptide (TPR) repeat protein